MSAGMRIQPFVVGAFEENCWLLVDETVRQAVLVDPGDEGERLVREVERSGATLTAIWLTHAHVDHIGGIAAVKRMWDVPIFMHPGDLAIYTRGDQIAAMYGLPFDTPTLPERDLADGDVTRCGSLEFRVMTTPGHAPGHVVFHGHGVAFVGDCLFAGSIGRTDLPMSNPAQLARSLERIMTLDDSTRVLPGHGPETTIGTERRTNPFLSGAARLVPR